MSEPGTATFVITGTAVALLGPVLGPYSLIVFASLIGGLLAMSRTPMPTRMEAAKFVAIGTAVAVVLTGPAVWAVEKYTSVPANVALMPVAFALGAARTRVLTLIERGLDWSAKQAGRGARAKGSK